MSFLGLDSSYFYEVIMNKFTIWDVSLTSISKKLLLEINISKYMRQKNSLYIMIILKNNQIIM